MMWRCNNIVIRFFSVTDHYCEDEGNIVSLNFFKANWYFFSFYLTNIKVSSDVLDYFQFSLHSNKSAINLIFRSLSLQIFFSTFFSI